MCGVAGVVRRAPRSEDEELVARIVAHQRPRGPDAQAVEAWAEAPSGALFGHDRLSIIDLSTAANQPMRSRDGRLRIVYNGEIYNYIELRTELRACGHHFETASDTEVLLAAWAQWGPTALGRLNGMFAFALHDRPAGRTWLGRDRFGVKPLFYAVDQDRVIFASTPTVIARSLRRSPNLSYVARGLAYWLYEDDGALSQYEGVHAVPAGHVVEVSHGPDAPRLQLHRYYDFEVAIAAQVAQLAQEPERILIQRVREVLESAVSLRFRADVSVGISLSGGLDSSSVASIAAQGRGELVGFTYGAPDERASEGPLVATLAARHGITVQYIPSAQGKVLLDNFLPCLEAQDAPFVGSSVVAQFAVFRATHAAGIKVLLGGQGGDEALMGYHKFRFFQLRQLLATRAWIAVLRALLHLTPAMLRVPLSLRMLGRQWERYAGDGGMPALPGLEQPAPLELGFDHRRPLRDRQRLDVLRLSLPTLLRYEDRNSMAHSVESRLPFLDYRMMELGLALPDGLKLRGGWGKWVLREAMRGLVPDAIRLSSVKRGFDTNLAHALDQGLGATLRARLHDMQSKVSPWLSSAQVDARFADARLLRDPRAMTEAISLLWLSART